MIATEDRFRRPHTGFRAHLAAKGATPDEIEQRCAAADIALDEAAAANALHDPEKDALQAEAWSRWYALPLAIREAAIRARCQVPACALEIWAALSEEQRGEAVDDAGPWWAEHEAHRIRERDGIDPDAGDAREPDDGRALAAGG